MIIPAASIIGFFVGSTLLIYGVFVFSFGKEKLHRVWALFNIVSSIWGFGLCFATFAKSVPQADIWWKVAFTGSMTIPIVFFHVCYLLCNLKNKTLLILGYTILLLEEILLIKGAMYRTEMRYVLAHFIAQIAECCLL